MLSVLLVDPLGQYWQACPEAEYRPAGQLAHVVELAGDVWPAGQLVHDAEPLDEYVFWEASAPSVLGRQSSRNGEDHSQRDRWCMPSRRC